MENNHEASYGDHVYQNYKQNLEGSRTSESAPIIVGVAIFGLGRIGTIHLENLKRNSRIRILYCVEESSERANFARLKWNLAEPETRFLKPSEEDIIFNDSRVEAVFVCTPTFSHEHLVLRSLENGKAVFCEKPLALTDEGITKCLETAKTSSKTLHCAFNRRFDPGMKQLKARVQNGEIGQVQIVKTCSRDSPRPSLDYLKISGGIYHDCAVHDIDYICWLLGEYPECVTSQAHAFTSDIKALGDHDTVAIIMKFPSGVIGVIDLSRHSVYGYDQRVEVFGSHGMLTSGDHRPTPISCYSVKGNTTVPIYFSFASRYQEAYEQELDHFLDVIQGSESCVVVGDSILAVSKIASACEESAKTGKSIALTWDSRPE